MLVAKRNNRTRAYNGLTAAGARADGKIGSFLVVELVGFRSKQKAVSFRERLGTQVNREDRRPGLMSPAQRPSIEQAVI